MHPVLFHIGTVLIPSYGAFTAIGVLAGLFLAERTARAAGADPPAVWNLCIVAVFSALVGERLVLIALNWKAIERHPSWAFGLGMIHHPLLTMSGIATGAAAAALIMRLRRMPFWPTLDALAAPLALGLSFEQIGALLAGSGFGMEAGARLPWAVTYTNPLAARWSGAPLGIPLHPVQAYAALGFFLLAIVLFLLLHARSRPGDVAGICLLGMGAIVFVTEIWRDPQGRGLVFDGLLDVPQIAAILLVISGGLILRERKTPIEARQFFSSENNKVDERRETPSGRRA